MKKDEGTYTLGGAQSGKRHMQKPDKQEEFYASGAKLPPCSLRVTPTSVPGLAPPAPAWDRARPIWPHFISATLPRSSQTASLTQLFPKGQEALPSAPDCALRAHHLFHILVP